MPLTAGILSLFFSPENESKNESLNVSLFDDMFSTHTEYLLKAQH